ncbi:coronin binding protein [Cryptosporidium ryanae]|uniref:coronin binding protein n=1 Tax=Cryptosporidium ryanae TaxID=515981 RepID=UPI00351A328F|nr:coronin binding protein [Cryptosporidium ryanae]
MNGSGLALGEIVTQDIRHKITQKLQEIFGDDDVSVLTDYICHMINHNQTKEHITNELREFLSDEAVQFGEWVSQLVNSINDVKRQTNAGAGRPLDNVGKSSNVNVRVTNSEKSSFGDSSIQGNAINNRRVKYNNDQNNDSLDIAISNAIKSGESNSANSKIGIGKQKQFPFQTSVKGDLGRGQHYSMANSSSNQDFSTGPLIYTGNHSKQTRVNYRNTPYMRTNTFSGPGTFPLSMSCSGIGNTSSVTTHQMANKVKIRCKNWPNCDKGDNCFYIHPSEACKAWPLCSYGPACFYIHPSVPCRFGLACYNSICNYNHPVGWDPYHNEVPVFKYGGYKNSSLIINNSNSSSFNNGSANSNRSEQTNKDEIGDASMNVEATDFSNNRMNDSIHSAIDGTGIQGNNIGNVNIQL